MEHGVEAPSIATFDYALSTCLSPVCTTGQEVAVANRPLSHQPETKPG
jgi:hypothetical protein